MKSLQQTIAFIRHKHSEIYEKKWKAGFTDCRTKPEEVGLKEILAFIYETPRTKISNLTYNRIRKI